MSYVFDFNHEHERPPMEMKRAPRREGRQPGRDDLCARTAGPARVHDLDRCLPGVHGRRLAGRALRRGRQPPRHSRGGNGPRAGRCRRPLLVSVRSGAKFSMPGMMDTVLNLGLNDAPCRGWRSRQATSVSPLTPTAASSRCTAASSSPSRARHSMSPSSGSSTKRTSAPDSDLTAKDLAGLVDELKQVVEQHTGKPFPEQPASS